MSTRVIRNGRTIFRGYAAGETGRRAPVQALTPDEVQRQHDALDALPRTSTPASSIADRAAKPATVVPTRQAVPREEADLPWYCAADRITYRPVSPILTEHGWGTLGFWMKRWNLVADDVLRLVRNRYLDAATEPGGAVKWYRVLDERTVLDVIKTMRVSRSQVRVATIKKPKGKS